MRLPSPKRLQTNEAMVVSALIFLFAPPAAVWPTMASGLGFLDALFETISAVTTTGLSTTSTLADKPTSFLFARAWMQWVGGLGIVVLSLAVLIQPGMLAKRLGDMQDYEEDMIGGTRAHACRVFIVYVALTAAGIVFLGLLDTGWFEAILYCFAAVSTGGFAPHDASLAGLQSHLAQALIILLSVAGGISLILYQRLFHSGLRDTLADHQLQGYFFLGLLMTLLLASSYWLQDNYNWKQALGHEALNALSAQSTARFPTLNLSDIDGGSKLVLAFSMFVGGSIGSTAADIKILRLLILMRLFYLTDSDQANIITALLGQSMGFKRVVPSIEDAELQQLCGELELEDTIIPVRTMSQYLENVVRGLDNIELSTVLKHDARLFTFVAGEEDYRKIKELQLPEDTEVLFIYREDQFNFVDKETAFKESDEVVILTASKNLKDLKER